MTEAQVRMIDASLVFPVRSIQLCWNTLAVEVAPDAQMSGKYKRVDL